MLRAEEMLKRGIGVHHGGLLPIIKETVELLFQVSSYCSLYLLCVFIFLRVFYSVDLCEFCLQRRRLQWE